MLLSQPQVPGWHGAAAARELLSLGYPRALTARGVVARRSRHAPCSRHVVYTDARRNVRCVTSARVTFRFAIPIRVTATLWADFRRVPNFLFGLWVRSVLFCALSRDLFFIK